MDLGAAAPTKRYDFIDWYRGLACVLMFQTHAYDRWLAEPDRAGLVWWTSRHLGGFPSRLFLMLAGVSLVLRFDRDRKKSVPPRVARWGAVRRGLEILILGLLFRFQEWVLGGHQPWLVSNIYRVDILNCIGASLMIAACVLAPWGKEAVWPERLPIARPTLLALAIVFVTPYLEGTRWPSWLPGPVLAYAVGRKPLAFFPLFPWLSYLLFGCAAGALWIRAAAGGKLPRAIGGSVIVGALMALGGQLARSSQQPFFDFGDRSPPPTSPTAFFYRAGMCLVGAGLAFLVTRNRDSRRFSAMRQLGLTSLLVYWVHVELVYGHLSDDIDHRLGWVRATLLLLLLCAAMLALSWLKTRYQYLWRSKKRQASPQKIGS